MGEAWAFVVKADIWHRQDRDMGPLGAVSGNNPRRGELLVSDLCVPRRCVMEEVLPLLPLQGEAGGRGGQGRIRDPLYLAISASQEGNGCSWLWHAPPLPGLTANMG